jgi:hypothetical protein
VAGMDTRATSVTKGNPSGVKEPPIITPQLSLINESFRKTVWFCVGATTSRHSAHFTTSFRVDLGQWVDECSGVAGEVHFAAGQP